MNTNFRKAMPSKSRRYDDKPSSCFEGGPGRAYTPAEQAEIRRAVPLKVDLSWLFPPEESGVAATAASADTAESGDHASVRPEP